MAVDVETTGLDFEAECIIELAGARFENGIVTAEFQAFFPPTKSLTAISRLLTGLNEKDLSQSPPAAESLKAFLEFAGELPLVAHNAEFDSTFVGRALEREGLHPLPGPWLDSLLLSRAAWPTWERHRLDYLSERLGILRDAEHRALPDARRAGQLFLAAHEALQSSVSESTWKTLGKLTEGLPGWGDIFSVPHHPKKMEVVVKEDFPVEEKIDSDFSLAGDIAKAVSEKKWIGFETPPREDETILALRSALKLATSGSRVLLCVPDAGIWDAVRKRLWPALMAENPSVRFAALAEPQNYLCRNRLQQVVEDPAQSLPVEERAFAIPLVAWADQTSSSLIADCKGFSPDRTRLFWSRVRCDAYADDPGAQAARVEANSAQVVLVTHAALCAHLRLDGALLPACDIVVFSGSHRLSETARRAFGQEVSFFRLHHLLQLLRPSGGPDGNFPENWFEPERALQRFLQKLGRQAVKRRVSGESRMRFTEPVTLSFAANMEPVVAALKANEDFLKSCQEDLAKTETQKDQVANVNRILSGLRSFRLDFEKLCDARDNAEVYWLEDFSNPHKAALRSVPVRLDSVLGARLRSLFDGGVFISPAVMLAGQQPAEFFLNSIGMQPTEGEARVQMRRVPDTQPPKFLLAPFVSAPASMESGAEFAKILFEAGVPFSEKGIFVFFPSVGVLRVVYQALRALLPPATPLWAQQVDGNKDTVGKLFASARSGWVLATEGMEGLRDGEGNSPGLFIVARMPLLSSREPLWEAQGEAVRSMDRNPRYELWHPSAALRLKRELIPMRRSGGLKAIWLFDARASGEGLGSYAGRSLDCEPETVANIEALQIATRAVFG